MWFADDIVITAESIEQAQTMLESLETMFSNVSNYNHRIIYTASTNL